MKPVKQSTRHDPNAGAWGDCHRAALASIFELELEAVPHFAENYSGVEEFNRRVDAWLAKRNLTAVLIPYSGSLPQVLATMAVQAPGTVYLLGGSARGVNHVVVGVGARVVHDPARYGMGLTGPADDGYFWVTLLVPRAPEKWMPAWDQRRRPRWLEWLVSLFQKAGPSPLANVHGSSWNA